MIDGEKLRYYEAKNLQGLKKPYRFDVAKEKFLGITSTNPT